ncbi:MAG: hypothetical protein ABJB12_23140 [Pseudomonadota bacterium]
MNRALACFALSLLAACSAQSSGPGEATSAFRGTVELGECADGAPDVQLVRGNAEAAPGVIAAVCGNLDAQNALTLSKGALAVSGDWLARAPARVGGAAFVNGNLRASDQVTIDGVLHTDASNLANVTAASVAAAGTAPSNPLECAQAPVSAEAIARIEANGVIDMGDALTQHSETASVTLGCARYRFSSWGIDNDLVLHITASTVIVIDGNVRIAAPVHIELAPDAKLDLIVGGTLQVDSALSLTGGSTWLGVGGDLRLAAPVTLDGSLFAPRSDAALDDTLDINGALFVGGLRITAPLTVTALPGSEPGCAQLL